MGKKLLLFLIIVLFCGKIIAQEKSSSLVWGLRLGMNWSTIKSDFDEGLETRTSGVIGAFSRHKIGGGFWVQPEVNYTLKGATRKFIDEYGSIFNFTLSFDYFEIPVLLRYNFGSTLEDRFKPEIFLGPFLDFKLSSYLELDDVPDSDSDIDHIKPIDYGIAFGTCMGFKIDNVDLLIELRYTLSLTTFDNNTEQYDLRNGKFGVFSISTGFAIN